MIKVAQRHYPALTFQEANVERLPFGPDSFDVAAGNYVVHHFARPDAAFREIHRVLKPGGCFVFATAMETSGFGAFIAGVAAHYTLDELPHGPLYLVTDKSVFESTIRAGGFTKDQLEIRDLFVRLATLEPLLRAGWDICDLAKLPQEVQDKIEATTREKAAPYKTNEGYEFPKKIVIGRAVKG